MNSREWQDPHFLEKGREKRELTTFPLRTQRRLWPEKERNPASFSF